MVLTAWIPRALGNVRSAMCSLTCSLRSHCGRVAQWIRRNPFDDGHASSHGSGSHEREAMAARAVRDFAACFEVPPGAAACVVRCPAGEQSAWEAAAAALRARGVMRGVHVASVTVIAEPGRQASEIFVGASMEQAESAAAATRLDGWLSAGKVIEERRRPRWEYSTREKAHEPGLRNGL